MSMCGINKLSKCFYNCNRKYKLSSLLKFPLLRLLQAHQNITFVYFSFLFFSTFHFLHLLQAHQNITFVCFSLSFSTFHFLHLLQAHQNITFLCFSFSFISTFSSFYFPPSPSHSKRQYMCLVVCLNWRKRTQSDGEKDFQPASDEKWWIEVVQNEIHFTYWNTDLVYVSSIFVASESNCLTRRDKAMDMPKYAVQELRRCPWYRLLIGTVCLPARL